MSPAPSATMVTRARDLLEGMSPRARLLHALLATWLVAPPLLLGLIEWRRMNFERIAGEHRVRLRGVYKDIDEEANHVVTALADRDTDGRPHTPEERRLNRHHLALYVKYAEAAASPWLPVWPDPPEPD
jgi:hypothetical protein